MRLSKGKLSWAKFKKMYIAERRKNKPDYQWNKLDAWYIHGLFLQLIKEYGENEPLTLSA